jgi:diguanylate cyclase (GGDEF)-like protein/PAS domain S-box-containing protein
MGKKPSRPKAAAVRDQDLLRAVMDGLPDAVYFKDREGRFIALNRAAAEKFGLKDPAAAVGKTDFDFFADPVARRFAEQEREIVRSGRPVVNLEEKEVWPDGRETWASTTQMPLFDPKGRVIGTFGLSRDITAQKQQEEQLRNSEGLYHSLVESLPQSIFRKDLEGRFTFANQKFCQSAGKKLEDLVGKTDFDFYPAELARKYREDDLKVIKTGKIFETIEEHQDPGQEKIFVHVVKTPIVDFRGYVTGVEGIFWDETEYQRALQKLADSDQRYALALEGANDGIWDWDLRTDAIYFSRRWKEMLGCADVELGSSPEEWFKRVHPEDLEGLKAALHAHRAGRSAHFENEHRVLHRQKAYRWVLARGMAVRDAKGNAVRMAGSLTDITDRKRVEEELARQAFYDPLTDLPNRALFLDRLNQALRRARRREGAFAVLFLDVDRFKDVNDSLGHAVGDQLLTAVARRLEASVRPGDTVARLGGDEFAVLLDDLRRREDAIDVSSRILRDLREPFPLAGQEVYATVSIGIAPGSPEDSAEDLLRDADTAMYRAKERGRNTTEIFDQDMHARAVARLALETDLRKALDRGEFRVYYQPIVSLSAGSIVGFEALVRWQHPQRGLVSPNDFIPLAEETGLVVPLDLWVMGEACRQTRRWRERWPELSVNVNLSTRHFSQQGLAARVAVVLKDAGLEPGALRIEITEGVLLEDVPSISSVLAQLKGMNIKLYLDDFGTGYSSLGYLHRFPIDSLKIHHSFVGKLGKKGDDGELVRTITTLASNLKMGVVAEGVETKEQLELLKELRCERVQGFLFSRPVPTERAEELLVSGGVNGNGR